MSRSVFGWNYPPGYSGPPPNDRALAVAREILDTQCAPLGMVPTRVVASAEGGVGLVFTSGDRYADIEVFNDGDIAVLVSSHGTGTDALDIRNSPEDLRRALIMIRVFLA